MVHINIEDLPKVAQEKAARLQKLQTDLIELTNNGYDDKLLIATLPKYYRILKRNGYPYYYDEFKATVSKLYKIQKTLTSRGLSQDTKTDEILSQFKEELQATLEEKEELYSEEFQDKLEAKIKEEKERLTVVGADFETRVKDFEKLNYLLSYKFNEVEQNTCSIPTVENPKLAEKVKKIKISKAKAQAFLFMMNQSN